MAGRFPVNARVVVVSLRLPVWTGSWRFSVSSLAKGEHEDGPARLQAWNLCDGWHQFVLSAYNERSKRGVWGADKCMTYKSKGLLQITSVCRTNPKMITDCLGLQPYTWYKSWHNYEMNMYIYTYIHYIEIYSFFLNGRLIPVSVCTCGATSPRCRRPHCN